MSRAPSVPIVALSLLIAIGAAAQPAVEKRKEGTRRIELGAESSRVPPELRISPSFSTVVLFDTPPSRVEVDEPQLFRRVRVAGDTLTLVPSAELAVGARVTLTVYFLDGQAPEHTSLRLVVDESSAERQVEVHRRPPPRPREPMQVEELRKENLRLRQELAVLAEENLRLRQAMSPLLSPLALPGGPGELFVDGPLMAGDLAVRRIDPMHANAPDQPLQIRGALAYRLGTQMALVLELDNTDKTRSWQVRDAILESAEGTGAKALSVWVDARLGPDERGHVVLGAKALRKTRGPFTLRLQDAEGGPSVTLKNIVFP